MTEPVKQPSKFSTVAALVILLSLFAYTFMESIQTGGFWWAAGCCYIGICLIYWVKDDLRPPKKKDKDG